MQFHPSNNLKKQFANFLENNPPDEFSRNLRKMLLDYLCQTINGGIPVEFERLLSSLEGLFDLLDVASLEIRKSTLPIKGSNQGKYHKLKHRHASKKMHKKVK